VLLLKVIIQICLIYNIYLWLKVEVTFLT